MNALPSRRHVLLASLFAGVSLPRTLARAFAPDSTPPGQSDPTSRALFDATDAALNDGNGTAGKNNESGALGWCGSYTMQAYLLMYRTYGDTRYLDKLIAQFDAALRQRDSVRGVTDYRGLSLPAWRNVGHYTCGSVSLKDAVQKPVLIVRSAVRPAGRTKIALAAGTKPGTFKLTATTSAASASAAPFVDAYDNLTMDPASADYAPRRIKQQFTAINGTSAGPRTLITAADARPDPQAGPNPAPGGPFSLAAPGYIYAVHTGQITLPIADFIRLVRETPALRENPRYKQKADEFLDAVEQAVALCDYEWREDEKAVRGWLIFARGSPNPFDGVDQPFNQFLTLGRTMVHLSAIGSTAELRDRCRDRAVKMARTFKSDLTANDDGSYSWPYFWSQGYAYRGWSEKDDISDYQPSMCHPSAKGYKTIEDVSHATLDIDFARLVQENQLGVFDEQDMRRLAKTFTARIATVGKENAPRMPNLPCTFERVDGTGVKGTHDIAAAAWVALAPFDKAIFTTMRDNYAGRKLPQPEQAVSLLLGLARLNWFAQRGA